MSQSFLRCNSNNFQSLIILALNCVNDDTRNAPPGLLQEGGNERQEAEPYDNMFPSLTVEPRVIYLGHDLQVSLQSRLPESVSIAAP